MNEYPKTEYRDGMRIDWDIPIEMSDGTTLRADIYRPPEDGEYPVIMSHGPYGKWLQFEQLYADQWERMSSQHPDVPADSSNKYQNWEVVDPEKWIPDNYAVVRVDSRGAGRSPGYLDCWSQQETEDFAECIEWAGSQAWSNGNVGLNGISYYAMNQWQVATLQPDHLTAMCAWEGASDWYRELGYHGGIYCSFAAGWYERQVESVQYGVGKEGYRSQMTGDWVAGPETLPEEERAADRADLEADFLSNELATAEYWESRSPDWDRVETPFLSAANWGGQGLHPRGNFEAFTQAATDQKWLEVHGIEHWTEFYTNYGLDLQKQFFDYFLKEKENGWSEQPRVQLNLRRPENPYAEQRHANDWPLPETEWTRYYLNASNRQLQTEAPEQDAAVTYDAFGDGVTFLTQPVETETELTGPMAAKLFVESDTTDADLFLIVRVFTPDLEEVVFQGALDPHKPVANGWLRASHRKLDTDRSEVYRPYHTHDEKQPLEPGEIYELDVEIWPSCIIVPEEYRIGLSVRGNDYEYPGDVNAELGSMEGSFTGVGPFRHDDARDRPPEVYGGNVTLRTGPDYQSHLLLPIIPDV